jgi:hypothetical protein
VRVPIVLIANPLTATVTQLWYNYHIALYASIISMYAYLFGGGVGKYLTRERKIKSQHTRIQNCGSGRREDNAHKLLKAGLYPEN